MIALHRGSLPVSIRTFSFETTGLAAGVYVVRAEGTGLSLSRCVTVLR